MTNEEAIKLIDDRMCWGRGRWSKHHMPEIDEYWQAGVMAIDALKAESSLKGLMIKYGFKAPDMTVTEFVEDILPSAQQEEAIPLEWIAKHLEWLDNCDNDFVQLAKVSIRAMVEIWKKEKT